MNKVIHFEIPADDVARAQIFYQKVFGWKINPVPAMDYSLVETGPVTPNVGPTEPGYIGGGIMARSGDFKAPDIVIEVDKISVA